VTPVLRRRAATAAVVLSTVLLVSACGGGAGPTGEEPSDAPAGETSGAFPVTLEHALGSTTVEREPERVVTWGWGAADAAIALGVTPVAIPFQSYGGDDEGVLPWIRQALEEAGEEIPAVLPDTGDEVPFEEIAATEPDLILAPYSGVTEEQYATLSEIAPVVAYPQEAWSTPWRDVVSITGEALGRAEEAEELLADIDARLADERAAHPEFEGVSLAAVWHQADAFYVYADEDPRVEFMLDLGFVSAPAVDTLETDEATFYFTLSTERLDELTSDVLVAYATTDEELQGFLRAPYAQVMPQVARGAVAPVVGTDLVAAVSPPTALSLPWGLDEVVTQLATAVAALEG
jgi:iron complex transport system substrate-binding protein